MMQSPSKLKPGTTPLVLDASVVINLVGSNSIDAILIAIDRPIFITESACAEFKKPARDGRSPQEVIEALRIRGLVEIPTLSHPQFEIFLRLTGYSPPDDLGDGEAATLAYADSIGHAVIDDGKALRIARQDFPDQVIYSSLDLFCAEQVLRGFGKSTVAQAVYDAIKTTRMRIPHHWKGWVLSLLGVDRATELPVFSSSVNLQSIPPPNIVRDVF